MGPRESRDYWPYVELIELLMEFNAGTPRRIYRNIEMVRTHELLVA